MRKVKLEDLKNTNISGIYKIDFPNNKSYIGQSQNIYRRIMEHNRYAFFGHGKHSIQICEKAINKYGQIKQIIILQENIPLEKLSEKEKYWINFYETMNKEKGYNILTGTNVSEERGFTHPNSAFSKDQVNNIYNLLINQTSLSFSDIAKKYNVHPETIRRICYGYTYKNDQLFYPLRKNNHESNKKELVTDYFQSEEKLLNLKKDLLYRWDLTIEKDLIKKYKIPLQVLRDINQGKKFSNYGKYEYPIRKSNIRNIYNFSQEDIKNILNNLRYTNKSMTDIGKEYNIHRDTISKINKGKTYIIEGYNYPARKS